MKLKNNPMRSGKKCCGAKTRSGDYCQSYEANGKGRCRMHGGAKGSGAPFGNINALKHGFYTKENINKRKGLRALPDIIEEVSRALFENTL